MRGQASYDVHTLQVRPVKKCNAGRERRREDTSMKNNVRTDNKKGIKKKLKKGIIVYRGYDDALSRHC